MKKVIVTDFCQILFLYLVAYFVDKKNPNSGRRSKGGGGGAMCVSVNEGLLFVQDTV